MPISLFPDEENFSSSNWLPLDRDSTTWSSQITSEIKKRLPFNDIDISIIWNIKDDKKGYAIGSIVIVNTVNESKFIVPIIIKDFSLAPLDSIITQHRAMRLNDQNIQDALFSGNISKDVVDKTVIGDRGISDLYSFNSLDANGGLTEDWNPQIAIVAKEAGINLIDAWNNVDLETFAYYGVSDFSIVDELYEDIDKEAVARFESQIQDEDTWRNYYKFDEADTIVRIPEIVENLQGQEKQAEKKPVVIRKKGPGAYVVYANSKENLEPIVGSIDAEEVRDYLSDKVTEDPDIIDLIIQDVEANGEDGSIMPAPAEDTIKIKNNEDFSKPKETDIYEAYDQNGKLIKGVYFSEVTGPDGKKKKANIFLTSEGGGEQGNGFKASPISQEFTAYNKSILYIGTPSVGDYGYFVYGTDIIGPFNIEVKEGNTLKVTTDSGAKKSISFDQAHLKKPNFSDRYISLPSAMKWVKVKNLIKYKTKKIEKNASIKKYGEKYKVEGIPAYKNDDLALDELKYVLASAGGTIGKIAFIVDQLSINGELDITYTPPEEVEKIEENPYEKVASLITVDPNKYDFVKMASEFEKIDTVDRVLSLNFINPATLSKFVAVLPSYENTMEELVRLLVVSRLGLTEVKENTILQALDALEELIQGLKLIKLKIK